MATCSGSRHGVLSIRFDIDVKDAMLSPPGAEVVVERIETSRENWDLKWENRFAYHKVQWLVPRDDQDKMMKSQLMKLLKDINENRFKSVAFGLCKVGLKKIQTFVTLLWEAAYEADIDIKIILCTLQEYIQEIHGILQPYKMFQTSIPVAERIYELLKFYNNDSFRTVREKGCAFCYKTGILIIFGSKRYECETFIKKAIDDVNKLEADYIRTSNLDHKSLYATIDRINEKRTVYCIVLGKDSVKIYGRTSTSIKDARKEIERCQPQKYQRGEKTFHTKENIKILVYVGDILDLNVDCIVNAAHPSLIHIGGISAMIAKAAGKELKQDCEEYIKKNNGRGLAAGKAIKSRAGKLKYKCVVHAVGPCWKDFSPYTEESVKTCETLLRTTISNSMVTAKTSSNVRSIAFPAISSGKTSRVPREFCCVQYAKAMIEYSKNTLYPLEEIHFVDTNSEMIQMIADTFDSMINYGRTLGSYNRNEYISTGHTNSLGKGATASTSSSSYSSKPTTSYPSHTFAAVPNLGRTEFTCSLGLKQTLYIYSADILKVPKMDLIVCGDDLNGKHAGYLANALWNTCGEIYKKNKSEAFKDKSEGDVVFCQTKKYRWVAHVLLIMKKTFPTEQARQVKVNSMFHAIFDGMKSHGCRTMALPLIGTGKGSGDPGFYAERFIESLLHFCSFQKMFVFDIHLVNFDSSKSSKAIEVVKFEIYKASKSMKHHQPKHSTDTRGNSAYNGASVDHRNKSHGNRQRHSKRPSSAIEISRASANRMTDVRKNSKPNFSQSQRHSRTSYCHYSSEDEASSLDVVHTKYEDVKNKSKSDKNSPSVFLTSSNASGSPTETTTYVRDLSNKSDTLARDSNVGSATGNLRIFSDNNTPIKPDVTKDKPEISSKDNEGADSDEDSVGNWDNNNVDDENQSEPEHEEMEVDNEEDQELVDDTPEDCVICMDTIDVSNSKVLPCGHKFCADCIDQQFVYKEACPTCGFVCGVIKGEQPHGDMKVNINPQEDCAGYKGYGRIEITYRFQDGRQNANHPDPGKPYKGIKRTAYLPYNKQGKTILEMLKVAFGRKLIFTIGRSRTTGADSVITWNDIHHKTDPKPNSQFGYPDPTYLDRVTDELKAKGVTENDIPQLSSRGRRH